MGAGGLRACLRGGSLQEGPGSALHLLGNQAGRKEVRVSGIEDISCVRWEASSTPGRGRTPGAPEPARTASAGGVWYPAAQSRNPGLSSGDGC